VRRTLAYIFLLIRDFITNIIGLLSFPDNSDCEILNWLLAFTAEKSCDVVRNRKR